MKNQYFGDVNDFRKYGLLRCLQSVGGHRLLVAWMRTPDDGGTDGSFRTYLAQPAQWRSYDPDLFAGITALLPHDQSPRISSLERSGLLPRASYYSQVVPDAKQARGAWGADLFEAASACDLVFVDPDDGIEVPSKPVGRKDSSKYVTWWELEKLWQAGCSLLVYQHFCREHRESFANRLTQELTSRTGSQFSWAWRQALLCAGDN